MHGFSSVQFWIVLLTEIQRMGEKSQHSPRAALLERTTFRKKRTKILPVVGLQTASILLKSLNAGDYLLRNTVDQYKVSSKGNCRK